MIIAAANTYLFIFSSFIVPVITFGLLLTFRQKRHVVIVAQNPRVSEPVPYIF